MARRAESRPVFDVALQRFIRFLIAIPSRISLSRHDSKSNKANGKKEILLHMMGLKCISNSGPSALRNDFLSDRSSCLTPVHGGELSV